MTRMKGGELIAEYLAANRIPYVFASAVAIDFATEDFDCAITHGVGGSLAGPRKHASILRRLAVVGLPALFARRRREDIASLLRSVPIKSGAHASARPVAMVARVRAQGGMPRPALIVENRAQAIAAAVAGSGVTLIHPKLIEAPSPMTVLAMVPGKTVPLLEGCFFCLPERSRGRRNVNQLGAWLASDVAKAG